MSKLDITHEITYPSTFIESRAKGIVLDRALASERSLYTWPKQHESNCHLPALPHTHLYPAWHHHTQNPCIHSPTINIIPGSHLKIQPSQGQVNSSQPRRWCAGKLKGTPTGTLTSCMTSLFQRRSWGLFFCDATLLTICPSQTPAVVWL